MASSDPVKSSNLETALGSAEDESKAADTKSKVVSTIVGSYEEYLSQRGYEPWRTKTEHGWFVYNPNKFVSCAPSFLYEGFKKPAAGGAARGTIIETMEKRTVNGEEQEVKVRTIEVNGQKASPNQLVWCNPNREIDARTKMAKDTYKQPATEADKRNDLLDYDTRELEMQLFQVVSPEEIVKVDYKLRTGLFGLFFFLNHEWRYQKHTYNWGLGSTFRDFCIIWTCFFVLWGFTGLLFYFLMLAQLASAKSAAALWMYCFCMVTGWIVIGIALHARSVQVAREKRDSDEEQA